MQIGLSLIVDYKLDDQLFCISQNRNTSFPMRGFSILRNVLDSIVDCIKQRELKMITITQLSSATRELSVLHDLFCLVIIINNMN